MSRTGGRRRPPLLLLPGMMCDGRLFAPQMAALADDAAEIAVGDIGGGETIEAIAEQVLRDSPWPRFALAGLSMGGIVAMEIMRQAPGRIERLALLDTNHHAELPEQQMLRGPQIERVLRGDLQPVLVEEMKPAYLAPESRVKDSILVTVLDMALDLGAEVFARQSAALRDRGGYGDVLRRVAVPTLVLCGAHDSLCPPERHREMSAMIPGARLVVVDGAGHLPTLERPAETSDTLRAWLRSDD